MSCLTRISQEKRDLNKRNVNIRLTRKRERKKGVRMWFFSENSNSDNFGILKRLCQFFLDKDPKEFDNVQNMVLSELSIIIQKQNN